MVRRETIARGATESATVYAEVRRIVHEEFVRWLNAGIAGPEEAYESLANRLWEAVAQFRLG
jgi:hypothetical protein